MLADIYTNVAANDILFNLSQVNSLFNTSVQRLSTGLRINSAADDPAGLVISENFQSQVNGLGQAIRNAQDGINLVQTADSALSQIGSQLQSIRSLVLEAANQATSDSTAVAADQQQISSAITTINNIAAYTQFGSQYLLNGSFSNKIFQIGAYASQTVSLTISNVAASSLGVVTSGTVSNVSQINVNASASQSSSDILNVLDSAINQVTSEQASLGAFQTNTLQATLQNNQTEQHDLTQTVADIRDANVALETLNFSRAQILQQTGLAVLAQANQEPNQLLVLFK